MARRTAPLFSLLLCAAFVTAAAASIFPPFPVRDRSVPIAAASAAKAKKEKAIMVEAAGALECDHLRSWRMRSELMSFMFSSLPVCWIAACVGLLRSIAPIAPI
ncbi:unnamed protein product [Closterium sp. Yama58-4]|nr:unnamed protein product [Closterium sp. Yama58-4]